jgi:hypothetical protein
VLSGVAPAERQAQALAAVQALLVDDDAGLIHLLAPPFVHSEPSPGYIQADPPGVRENGGQYSHAGVWALMAQVAWAKTQPDPGPGLAQAWSWFEHLSPAHRAADPAQAAAYEIEPYVMAGDVYTAPPYVGRGGWSWYTGSAAWMHRAAVESLFGLQLGPDTLYFAPGLPPHWPRAELTLRRDGRHLRFLMLRCEPAQALAQAAPWRCAQSPTLLLPGATLDAVPLKRVQYIEGASSGQPIGIFYMVEMEYPPEALPQMTHWYHFEHLPGLSSVKGNVRSTRYLSEAGRSFACYDLVSEDVPQTAEWSQWRETALTVSVRPFYRNMKRGMYRATKI